MTRGIRLAGVMGEIQLVPKIAGVNHYRQVCCTCGATFLTGLRRGLMIREFNVVIERDEEGYLVASVPSLPGCHTQAKSLDELMDRVREAIALCLEVETESAKGLEF